MATIFSRIANGEVPSYKVAENEEFVAFLDINPLQEGHTLVVPKIEVDYIFDLDPELLGRMMKFSQLIAAGIKKAISCKKVGVMVVGLDVPHAHIHLIPINEVKDMCVMNKKLYLSAAKFYTILDRIIKEIVI